MKIVKKIDNWLSEQSITNAELRAAGTPIPRGIFGWDLPDEQAWDKKKVIDLAQFNAMFLESPNGGPAPKTAQAKAAYEKELKAQIAKAQKATGEKDLSNIDWVPGGQMRWNNFSKDFTGFAVAVGAKVARRLAKSAGMKLTKTRDASWAGHQMAWKWGKQIAGVPIVQPAFWKGKKAESFWWTEAEIDDVVSDKTDWKKNNPGADYKYVGQDLHGKELKKWMKGQ